MRLNKIISTTFILLALLGQNYAYADISITGKAKVSFTPLETGTYFDHMDNTTFATFDIFVDMSSEISEEEITDALTKNHPINTHRLAWKDSSGNKLTTVLTNNSSGGSTTTSITLRNESGELYDRASDGAIVLTFLPTTSLNHYLNPNFKSSVVGINASGSTSLIDDISISNSYIYNPLNGNKTYISRKNSEMRLSALSEDGSVVIGTNYLDGYGLGLSNNFEPGSGGYMAFKIDSNGLYQGLGNYNESSPCSWNSSIVCEKYSIGSVASDISNDASTIIGTLSMLDKGALSIGDLVGAFSLEAFTWNEVDGFETLGSISDSKKFSVANAVNSNGSIIVGVSESDTGKEAFKWNSLDGMTALGDLPGGEYFSNALDVNNDGSKIVGFSSVDTDTYEAFKWTLSNGMVGLGRPSASESSLAMGISGDGNIIVGTMGDLESKSLNAFRWDSDNGMRKVTSWLTDTGAFIPSSLSLDIATSTNKDGSIVGGMSGSNAWLAFSGRGVIFPDTYTPTLITPKVSNQASFELLDLTLDGSHHLPLKSMPKSSGECFWINGDWSDKKTTGTDTQLLEIGSCLDLNIDTRIGLGLGKSKSNKVILNETSFQINGNYLYSEIGTTPLENKSIVLSMSAFLGSWDSDITRYYLNSLSYDSSTGTPNILMTGVKARADYMDLFNVGNFSVSPSIGLTRSSVKTDAYLETGGGFPAQFDKQTLFRTVARIGIKGEKDIKDFGRLRIMADHFYETSSSNSSITGSIPGWTSFNIDSNHSNNDSSKIAFELDQRIDKDSLLSTMVSFKSDDEKWNNLTAISYKYGF